MSGNGEFDLIARHFAPLVTSPGARGLRDDAAVLDAGTWVVSVDCIVEGVHFLSDDPIDRVAQKALRVNLSDIAAKGAAPLHYVLALQWPDHRPVAQLEAFAAGLARDQQTFGCDLIGGDTTATSGPLAVSITVFGRPCGPRTPARADARPGDDLWVTGAIGDGVLGLASRRGELPGLSAVDHAYLVDRYQTPTPRTSFAPTIARFAHAAMDVSDGLLADAGKIAAASDVRVVIEPRKTPLSSAARAWLSSQPEKDRALERLLNGGDDYEILFSARRSARAALLATGADRGLSITRIGMVTGGAGLDAGGLAVGGHVHRLGA
ncbi:MAG: thiamine-phosphate kinase [Hyphomonadaceae bacterium]|nr:thiamine-phosphate kinase [Hyphomonadaceae bacterium]